MKKYFSILLLVFLFVASTYAQQIAIGFNAGAIWATYKLKGSDESATLKAKFGITTGFITDIPIGKKVSFQPAIQFTQKGGMLKDSIQGNKNDHTTTFNYLEFPLNMLYKTSSSKGRFYAGGGPSVALGLSGKSKDEVGE